MSAASPSGGTFEAGQHALADRAMVRDFGLLGDNVAEKRLWDERLR
jgi:hypothetical protein